MKKKVTITQEVVVDIPDSKVDDVESAYTQIIDECGTLDDVFEHIAYNYAINCAYAVEAVGPITDIPSHHAKDEIVVKRDRGLIEMETSDMK